MIDNNSHKTIGQLIKEEVERQGLSAKKFGEMIHCERANVYKIYERTSLDTAQLGLISKALNHNFFVDIVNDQMLSGVEDEKALKEISNRMAVSQFVEVVPKVLAKLGVEPSIFFGRPLDIPEEIPTPDYYISPYNITFSIGDLLRDKANCHLAQTANVQRFTDDTTGLQVDLWKFIVPGPDWVNLKLDYKTEEEWEYTLKFVFNNFYNQYNIIKNENN